MSSDKQNKSTASPVKTKTTGSFIVAVIFTAGAVTFLPTTLILAVGLLPTAVAAFTDNSRDRLAGLTVGCMNLAGVIPSILRLWEQGHSVESAMMILTQPNMLLLMYGGAAIGVMLYINTPLMVSGILRRQAAMRLKVIEKQYADLKEEWGPDVGSAILLEEEPAKQA